MSTAPEHLDDPDSPAVQMTSYAMKNWRRWRKEIEAWQSPVLRDPDLPDWFKSAVFNELYYLAGAVHLCFAITTKN